ncbi:MAG: hypothetical protein K2O05_01045 [Anaeroplasmataceae bacterium]|nr:hypothetical protein [Anaeroplasmataceae bacterium]
MKKFLCVITLLCFLLVSCNKKENDITPSELTIINQNGEEQVIEIKPTNDKEEIKLLFDELPNAKLDTYRFSGVKLDLASNISASSSVYKDNQEINIDLDYQLEASLMTNLKKYRMSGNVKLNGSNKVDSIKYAEKNNVEILADFTNDDSFVYLDILYSLGVLDNTSHFKFDISEFSSEYKGTIVGAIDLLKYYNPISMIPDFKDWIEEYNLSIIETTKDSFVIRFEVPTSLEDMQGMIYADVEFSCSYLLPTSISIDANEFIKEALEQKYIQDYLTEDVNISNAEVSFDLKREYDIYSIKEISEEKKSKYIELDLDKIKQIIESRIMRVV